MFLPPELEAFVIQPRPQETISRTTDSAVSGGVGFATAIHPEADESIPGRETTLWSCWSGQGVVHVGVSRALVAPNCHATIARSPIHFLLGAGLPQLVAAIYFVSKTHPIR